MLTRTRASTFGAFVSGQRHDKEFGMADQRDWHDTDGEEAERPLEVETDDGRRVQITGRGWSRRLLKDVFGSRPDAADAFAALVKAGCDGHYLALCLSAMEMPAAPLARIEVQNAATAVGKASEAIFWISLSAHADDVDPEGQLANLHRTLARYARRLRELAPRAGQRTPGAGDAALTKLLGHVQARTEKYHDDEVATLVEAVKQGVRRAGLFYLKTAAERIEERIAIDAMSYSTDTHSRWRRRHAQLGRATIAAGHKPSSPEEA
jgi:hypothetical protein